VLGVCDAFVFPWFGFRILGVNRDSSPPLATHEVIKTAQASTQQTVPDNSAPLSAESAQVTTTAPSEATVVRQGWERVRMSDHLENESVVQSLLHRTLNLIDDIDQGDLTGRRRKKVDLDSDSVKTLLDRISDIRKVCERANDKLAASEWIRVRAFGYREKLVQSLEQTHELDAETIGKLRAMEKIKIPPQESVERGLKHLASISKHIVNGTLNNGHVEDVDLLESFVRALPAVLNDHDKAVGAFLAALRQRGVLVFGGLEFHGPYISLDDMADAMVDGFKKSSSYYLKKRKDAERAKANPHDESKEPANEFVREARRMDKLLNKTPAREQYSDYRAECCMVLVLEKTEEGKVRAKDMFVWETAFIGRICQDIAAAEGKAVICWTQRVFPPAGPVELDSKDDIDPIKRSRKSLYSANDQKYFGEPMDPNEPRYVAPEAWKRGGFVDRVVFGPVPLDVCHFIWERHTDKDGRFKIFPKPTLKELIEGTGAGNPKP